MACLETDFVQESIHQPWGEKLRRTADPPSRPENSTQSPLNEVGMFQFKGIKSIFKMWRFPSHEVPAQPDYSPAGQGFENMLSTQIILDPAALYIPRLQAGFTFEGL